MSIKKYIVEADELDVGLRQMLNFGHTIGHCIEKASAYSIPHGLAIAKGMAAEAKACAAMNLTSMDIYEKISSILTEAEFDLTIGFDATELYKYALLDKKISHGKIAITVPDKIGQSHLEKISLSQLKSFFESAF